MEHVFGDDMSFWTKVSRGGVYGQGVDIWTGVGYMDRGRVYEHFFEKFLITRVRSKKKFLSSTPLR